MHHQNLFFIETCRISVKPCLGLLYIPRRWLLSSEFSFPYVLSPHSLGSMILSLLSLSCLFFFSLVRPSVPFPFLLLRSIWPFYRSHEPTLMAPRASIPMFINTTVPRGTLSISTMTIRRGTLSKRGRAPRAFTRF